jgi:hypothetical protein
MHPGAGNKLVSAARKRFVVPGKSVPWSEESNR